MSDLVGNSTSFLLMTRLNWYHYFVMSLKVVTVIRVIFFAKKHLEKQSRSNMSSIMRNVPFEYENNGGFDKLVHLRNQIGALVFPRLYKFSF